MYFLQSTQQNALNLNTTLLDRDSHRHEQANPCLHSSKVSCILVRTCHLLGHLADASDVGIV